METIEIVNRITTVLCACVLGAAVYFWAQKLKQAKARAGKLAGGRSSGVQEGS